jgi:arginase
MSREQVCITYVPCDIGSLIPGKSKAPKAIQEAGLVNKLTKNGLKVMAENHPLQEPARWKWAADDRDSNDDKPSAVRFEEENVRVNEMVRDSLLSSLKQNEGNAIATTPFQLIIGGECSMLPGIMSAFDLHCSQLNDGGDYKKVGLIYIDADLDLATPETTKTGTFAGMTMTHLLEPHRGVNGLRYQFLHNTATEKNVGPLCDKSNTVFLGTNLVPSVGNSPNSMADLAYVFDNQLRLIPNTAVKENPKKCAQDALSYLKLQQVDVIFVHLDVDSIDSAMFPLANILNYTGVREGKMFTMLMHLLVDERVAGLSIGEVNPDHDADGKMVGVLVDGIVQAMKVRREGPDSEMLRDTEGPYEVYQRLKKS